MVPILSCSIDGKQNCCGFYSHFTEENAKTMTVRLPLGFSDPVDTQSHTSLHLLGTSVLLGFQHFYSKTILDLL